MFSAILVPLDGSTFAQAALPAALDLARQSGGAIHLIRVHELQLPPADVPSIIDPDWLEAERITASAFLADLAAEIEDAGVACVTHLAQGVASEEILRYARAERIDLIVMSTHGRGGFSRLWFGSVASVVAQESPCPLYLIRPPETATARHVAPTVKHLVVTLDDSDHSRWVLPVATQFARMTGARVTLLRVFSFAPGATLIGFPAPPEPLAEAHDRAEQALEQEAARLRVHGLEVECVVLENLAPAPAILDYLRRVKADAIALSTHGRGSLGRLAIGSVADKVLRGSGLPALLYRPEAAVRKAPAAA